MKYSYLLFLGGMVSLNACNPKIQQATQETVQEAVILPNFVDEIKNRPHYNPSEQIVNDLVHTKLDVKFDWMNRQLNGEAYLTLKPHFYPTDSVVLDAKWMDIHAVKLDSASQDLPFTYENNFLTVKLPAHFTRHQNYTIYIKYTANPEKVEQEGSEAITDAKGLYFINHDGSDPKKHQEIWTQGETESSSVWFPTIDAPNQKTTQEIYITVDGKYTTLSNGLLVSSEDNNDGTRTDFWAMDKPHAPYLFMMAVGEFSVVKDKWKRKDGSEMEVNYYVEKEYEEHARAIFGKTPKMLSYFSDLLGVEYPWIKYSQIVVRDYVSGAMENTTATIHGDFLYQTKRELIDGGNESIIAHELFHHWFGDLVTCESWSNLPLNESFANYSQYLWDEFEYGRAEADMNGHSEMEGYFLSSEQGGHVDMIRFDYENKEDMFDGHSYNKGGAILHMLRTYLGDDAFFKSLKQYLTDNAYKTAEIHDLRLAFEKTSGQDLNWFFNQWFLASGHPVLTFNQEYSDSLQALTITIEQKQQKIEDSWPLYLLPINIDIYHGEKPVRHLVWLNKSNQTFTFKMTKAPDLVNIDGDKVLLAQKTDNKSLNQWIHQLKYAPLWLDKSEAIEQCGKSTDINAINALIGALDHPFWNVKTMAMRKLKNAMITQPEIIKTKLISLAKSDSNSHVRSRSIYYLSKYFTGDKGLSSLYESKIQDSSYSVIANSLVAIYKNNEELGFKYAKNLEELPSSDVNRAIAEIYAQNGTRNEHEFFIKNINELNAMNKYGFLQQYHVFLTKQNNDEIRKGIEVYRNVVEQPGAWFIRLSGYQLLSALQQHLVREESKLATQKNSFETSGETDKIPVLEAQIIELSNLEAVIGDVMIQLKEKEKDPQVKRYLGL